MYSVIKPWDNSIWQYFEYSQKRTDIFFYFYFEIVHRHIQISMPNPAIRVCQMCQSFKKSWLSFIFPLLDLNGWQKHQYYQIIWILEGGSTTPKFIVYSMKGESEQIGSSLKNHRRSNAINFNLTYVWGVLYQSPLMC